MALYTVGVPQIHVSFDTGDGIGEHRITEVVGGF